MLPLFVLEALPRYSSLRPHGWSIFVSRDKEDKLWYIKENIKDTLQFIINSTNPLDDFLIIILYNT
jgi:hypothetical protein